jgi:diguanylate cyclase (GGDEF)-like protein/PAS domain S-box-containing protein
MNKAGLITLFKDRWTLSPVARISFGLVSLMVGLLMLLDLALKLLPDERAVTQSVREQVAVNVAVQVKLLLGQAQAKDAAATALSGLLHDIAAQSGDITSIGIRRDSGELFVSTPSHGLRWVRPPLGLSTLTSVVVPLYAGVSRWGQLEIGYRSPVPSSLLGWLKQPTVQLITLLGVVSLIAFNLYLRRVLQHLDPSKAIPDRVRVAFDTLTEGLLVLDPQGRILLANAAFRGFHPQAGEVLLGRSISQLAWLVKGLKDTDGLLPWARALAASEPILGVEVDLSPEGGEPRRALLNCAAIRDAGGQARGCLLTLDDVTALDQANAHLRSALLELASSRDQVQRQNEELQTLASSDPLTGCFNRRAFFTRAEPLLAQALRSGEPLCCVITDIDRFKLVNDTHGHSVGDLVIQAVARVLKSAMREQDVLCRYGGEEFCFVLRGLSLAQAVTVADRVRARIEAEVGPTIEAVPGMRVTASFGVALLGLGEARTLPLLIDRADQGLYAAKEAGRNQVQSLDIAPTPAHDEAALLS